MTKAETISQLQERIDLINKDYFDLQLDKYAEALEMAIEALNHIADADKKEASFACNHEADLISRKEAIDEADEWMDAYSADMFEDVRLGIQQVKRSLRKLPSAQIEQRYTEEELRVFQHGISLSLLLKKSAQHWRYDEDTATEIKFLERLYEKVGADMRGEQDGKNT